MMTIAISISREPEKRLENKSKEDLMVPVSLVVVPESKELMSGPLLLPLGKAISCTLEHLQVRSLQCQHHPAATAHLIKLPLASCRILNLAGKVGRIGAC